MNKKKVDVIYVIRLQVERWSDEELQRNSNLPAVKREIESRKEKEKKDEDDG